MNTVKIVSTLFFYLTRFLAFLYGSTFAYSAFVLLFQTAAFRLEKNDARFLISFPFTQTVILAGEYTTEYVFLYFLTPLLMYSLFFAFMGQVFWAFFQPKLFTEKNYQILKIFYLGNFIVPIFLFLVINLVSELEKGTALILFLHVFLGVFAYFLAAIFRQGLSLQNEQDLII